MTSEKSKTNRKWTSNDKFRDGWDRCFGPKENITAEEIMSVIMDCEPGEVKDKIRESPVWEQFRKGRK
jgi:hypothetical protein